MNDCLVAIVSILCIIMKFKSIAYDNAYFVSVSTMELFIQIMTWYKLSGVLKLIIAMPMQQCFLSTHSNTDGISSLLLAAIITLRSCYIHTLNIMQLHYACT